MIDDDEVSRELTAAILAVSGYAVFTAEDGAASLQSLDAGEFTPDVILVDARMPGLSGAKLIAKLRARSRASIFVMSASRPSDAVLAAADGFLRKPFGVGALQNLLEKRQALAVPPACRTELVSAEPVVSVSTLTQLNEMMPQSAVKEIYAALVANLRVNLSALKKAVARNDAEEVRRIGHVIKGGCGMAGAMQAARVGALLEASSDQSDNNAALLRDLRHAIASLKRMLKAEFPA